MNEVPVGWHSETLAEVTQGGVFTDGDWVETKDQDPTGSVRLTQLADVGVGVFRDRSDRHLREDQAARLGVTFLEPNDVLVARMPDPIGRACLAPPSVGRAVTVVDVAVLRVKRSDVDPRYLMWAINSPSVHEDIAAMQSGTTRKRISRKNLATVALPIPPIAEQRRIVDILEDHLSRLDAADAALAAASRRSRSFVAAALTRMHGGATRALSEVALIQGGIQKQPKREPRSNAFPFLRVANVTSRGLDLEEVHQIELFDGELGRYRLERGDLLVVEGNGSPSQIGRAAIWDASISDCVHQNHLIRVRPSVDLLPEFLEAAWNAPPMRRVLTNVSSSSSGLHTLSVGKLKALRVPVPSIPEQRALAKEARAATDAARNLEIAVDAQGARSKSLRRALLSAAFSGRLTGHSSDLDIAQEMSA